jgi:hypothetical protein
MFSWRGIIFKFVFAIGLQFATEIKFPTSEIYIDHTIEIELKINCKAPCDVSCDKISLSFIETKLKEGNSKAVVCRQASDTSLTDHVFLFTILTMSDELRKILT